MPWGLFSSNQPKPKPTRRPIRLNATMRTIPDDATMHLQLASLRAALAAARRELNSTSSALLKERSAARALPGVQGQLRQAHAQLMKLQQDARRMSGQLRDKAAQQERQEHR